MQFPLPFSKAKTLFPTSVEDDFVCHVLLHESLEWEQAERSAYWPS
jgi:hypothetical protein